MPHPIDTLVGKRVRQGRWLRGVTQQQLGDAAGCKFQQIQKYETGTNRVSASRLWDIAQALDLPVTYFYDDGKQATSQAEPVVDRETAELLRAILAVPDDKRQAVLELVRSMNPA
ncbi:helix-turn-helix domain-containing protein [Limimaricola sp.]|uniref:helix-turn-helix domain-containing protein n=1 Tax=Limimaricola sp. TaxID=2211665 RepID=UPI004059B0A5